MKRKWKKRVNDLRRYTDLSALFYLLAERKLTLRDPANWDDKNDSYYLSLYKESSQQLKSVLALCFVTCSERYHLWQVFGAGRNGVRIRFRSAELFKAVEDEPGLRMERVQYRFLEGIEDVPIRQFPFVKRYGFKDESEFRMVYESPKAISKVDLPIPLSCIRNIKLNPWLPRDLFSQVRKAIQRIEGCSSLEVLHSHLIDNERWKQAGERVVTKFKVSRSDRED
jgi:hypothetical protein